MSSLMRFEFVLLSILSPQYSPCQYLLRCSLKPDPRPTYHNSAVEDHTYQWAQTIDGRINLARMATLSRLALHDTMPTPSLTLASGNGPAEASDS